MTIPVMIIIAAVVIVVLSGGHSDATQLYYDVDFAELYEVKESEEGERKYKGGEEYMRKPKGAEEVVSANAIPTTLSKTTSGVPDSKISEIAQDIYDMVDM